MLTGNNLGIAYYTLVFDFILELQTITLLYVRECIGVTYITRNEHHIIRNEYYLKQMSNCTNTLSRI